MDAIVAFDEEDLLPPRTVVRDPALEATLWLYRVVEDGGTEWCPEDVWRLDRWFDGRWIFAGRWKHRRYAESKMVEGAFETVHRWRSGLCCAYHIDYRLEAVEKHFRGTVLVETIRRHFWDEPSVFDGYVAA